PTKNGRKDKPHVIPYWRFTKLIICHLGRTHNIHQRLASLFHLAEEDLRLGRLKFVPKGHRLVPDVSKRLPLGGPPGQLKAANYPDFRLEELVPLLWIESERNYNISATNGITHWWCKRKDFYITRHNAPSDRHAVRSHMRILNVIGIKTSERYGYAFLREIVIRRADYNENIVIRQHVGDLQHRIKSYQTKLNLIEPRWDALDFLSEGFMEVIERRLKIRRIFRSLESFVGGRLRDVDYMTLNRAE
nr:hypothetical protein [Tanacetum cinerariifolium]